MSVPCTRAWGPRTPRSWLVLPLAVLVGCASPPSASPPIASPGETGPVAISCQPLGYTPAPIAISFEPGPVTAAEAEETAVALFRACQLPTIIDVRARNEAAAGVRTGPNDGQPVWLVEVEATVPTPPTGSYQSHFLIEVNQATGVPTLIAYG